MRNNTICIQCHFHKEFIKSMDLEKEYKLFREAMKDQFIEECANAMHER